MRIIKPREEEPEIATTSEPKPKLWKICALIHLVDPDIFVVVAGKKWRELSLQCLEILVYEIGAPSQASPQNPKGNWPQSNPSKNSQMRCATQFLYMYALPRFVVEFHQNGAPTSHKISYKFLPQISYASNPQAPNSCFSLASTWVI